MSWFYFDLLRSKKYEVSDAWVISNLVWVMLLAVTDLVQRCLGKLKNDGDFRYLLADAAAEAVSYISILFLLLKLEVIFKVSIIWVVEESSLIMGF